MLEIWLLNYIFYNWFILKFLYLFESTHIFLYKNTLNKKMPIISKQTCLWVSVLGVRVRSLWWGPLQGAALNMGWAEAVWEKTTLMLVRIQDNSSEENIPWGVKFQWTAQAVTAVKWPEITGCCSQTKTTDVPRQNKKKWLWLNCYSLSDHHNESTARRGSKRKSEEHPVIITVCVCKTLHTSSVSSVPPVETVSVSHSPSLVSSLLGLSGKTAQVMRQNESAKLLDWDADKSFLGNILEI